MCAQQCLQNRHRGKRTFIFLLLLVAALSAQAQSTLYSYQSGSWNNPDVWTTDPGGTTLSGSRIPVNNDIIVILPSRTVTLSADVAETGLDITIHEGGILNASTFRFTHTLAVLAGRGIYRLSSINFPDATDIPFVASGGGTVEYCNTVSFDLPAQPEYFNLNINAPGIMATQRSDITINGNLGIVAGTYRINDNTADRRSLIVYGDITVNTGSSLTVGSGNTTTVTDPVSTGTGGTAPFLDYYVAQSHRVEVHGNFTNEGTVRFTNQSYPVFNAFPTDGFATVFFRGASDNTITCTGTTDFYNIIIDKGADQTFNLSVNSSGYDKFRIFGANVAGGFAGDDANNPNIRKALWIRNGTLKLNGYVFIPSLVEGSSAAGSGDFYVPANGALILGGPDVVVMGTIDDYSVVNLAYGVDGGTGTVNGITTEPSNVPSGFSLYGKLQVNSGYFYTGEIGRIVYFGTASAQFIINGGIIDTKQFQSVSGGGKTAFWQTGGTLILRGRFRRSLLYTNIDALISSIGDPAGLNTARASDGGGNPLGTDPGTGTLNIDQDANIFHMEGGNIDIFDVTGSVAPSRAIEINSDPANVSVSGGNIRLIITSGTVLADADYGIASKAPLYNLEILRNSGTSNAVLLNIPVKPGVTAVPNPPLMVRNDLTLTNSTLDAAGYEVRVGGNFRIETGAVYTPGNNRTVLNGTGSQSFVNGGTITTGLYRMVIDKTSGTATLGSNFAVRDSLIIMGGILDDGGYTLQVAGNIFNAGSHTGSGKIQLNGSSVQYLSSIPGGSSSLGNLEMTNSGGSAGSVAVNLQAPLSVNSLTLTSERLFHIGSHTLTTGPSGVSGSGFSGSKMISTSGLSSDGGLRRYINSTYNGQTVTFPVGCPGGERETAVTYFPGRIHLGTIVSAGYFTVVPVSGYHPSCDPAKRNSALDFYWKTRIQDLVTSGTRHLEFDYRIQIPNSYNDPYYLLDGASEWGTAPGNNNSSTLVFPTSTGVAAGDFTAGKNSPFRNPTTFYSRQSGAWNALSTWSLTGHTGVAATSLPADYDNVIIGGVTGSRNDSVTVTANGIRAAIVTIKASFTSDNRSPVLNIQGYTGHLVEILRGAGKFCTSTNSIPATPTDYGGFLMNDTAVFQYYGGSYTLPASITTYPNLLISGNSVKTLNDSSITVRRNLIIADDTGSDNILSLNGASGDLTILGDLRLKNGARLRIPASATMRNINIYGNIDFTYGGTAAANSIEATGAGTVHRLNFFGRNIYAGASNLVFNPATSNKIDLYLKNAGSVTVTAGTGNFSLNRLFIQKESLNDTVYFRNNFTLNESANNTAQKSLVLGAGTLVLSDPENGSESTIDLNLSSGGSNYFIINSASALMLKNGARVNITGNTAGSGILLDGLLKAEDNSQIVLADGSSGNTGYIEYSGSGNAHIMLSGNSVLMASQIRRSLLLTTGLLSYEQGGSSAVTIYGLGTAGIVDPSRAKLEVAGAGSCFRMSGTSTLTFIQGGGIAFGDLFLRPETSQVTGGTIIFGDGITGQVYRIDANVPLNNLLLDAPSGINELRLSVNPLVLKGSLSLNEAGSTLTASGINLAVGGNFTCNGVYVSGQNTTFFNGASQAITGSNDPLFWNLASEPSSLVSIGRDITVNNDLRISAGIFATASFNTVVKGNVVNDATYSNDPSPADGRLLLNGSGLQNLSGTGSFGRIELNNTAGASLLNNLSLMDELILVNGSLDISQYSLVLGVNSYITGGPFSAARMIKSDGALSNGGILKSFADGYTGTFIYPSGVGNKYTPAVITIVSASAGSLRINPVNERHPATLPPYNSLNFYFDAVSSVSSFEGNFVLWYDPSDVTGDESQYVASRLIMPPMPGWSKAASGESTDNVDESAHSIWFNFPAGTDNLGGQYTAGYSSDLPSTVPVYSSNVVSGNWNDPGSWTPEPPPGGPNGFIVTINPGHTIYTNGNRRFSYTTTIQGTLDVGTTYEHNLGTVNGTGRLLLQGAVLPAGIFSSFLGCSGGTLEYSGETSYTIIADRIDTVRNLVFSGSGTRTLPDKDLVICNQLEINGPDLDNYFNRKLTIQGSFDLVSGTFRSGTGAGATVVFGGTGIQQLSGFSGVSSLNNLEINNSAGLVISTPIEIRGNLILTDGIITTTPASILRMTSQSSAASEGTPASFVNGPMTKNQLGGMDFIFPVGKAQRYGRLGLLNPQTGTWEAEYFNTTFADLTVAGTLVLAASGEYWRIKSPADGKKAVVQLRWDSYSEITPATVIAGLDDIRVAEYNGNDWIEKASSAMGNNDYGYVTTSVSTFIGNSTHPWYYTLGSVSMVRPSVLPGIPAPVCQCTSPAYLPYLATTGNPDQYSIDFDATANSEGFSDIAWTILPASPIPIAVPLGADPGIYNAVIRVRTSSPVNESLPYTFSIIVTPDFGWTGSVSSDWNLAGNWACNILPGAATSVMIPDVPNKPVLSSGSIGSVNNLTIGGGSSLTVSGNTLRIAGTITNDGSFDALNGRIEFNGTAAQVIGNGLFAGNMIRDLTVSNPAGVSLLGPISVTDILYLQNGNLVSNGNLTLASTTAGTALIDGTGTGQVTGIVTMQRYLDSGFGYKYFSSPFQAATVGEFGDDMDLASSFSRFYEYDENRWFDIYPLQPFVAYTNPAGILSPMNGYPVNFGSDASPKTIDVSGVVNNGSYSVTLYNNNHPISLGRNMAGNPYPSPIDWSAAQGWTKINIDNALYYFNASLTDEWSGSYSSWINGVSSDGVASNIIPSMQGFLVHVSDGSYPVTATLSLDNRVRVNNFTQPFMSKGAEEEKSLIRLTATFADQQQQNDPFVVYFDGKATAGFDSELDAFKYFNTDITVPNLYSFAGSSVLSINALPVPEEKLAPVPLGIKTERDGEIIFRLKDAAGSFAYSRIYLKDTSTGGLTDLTEGDYRVFLNAGVYNSRFSIGFEDLATAIPSAHNDHPVFQAYSSAGIVFTEISCPVEKEGMIILSNLTGQTLMSRKIYSNGHYEFTPGVRTGVYIISFVSGNKRLSESLFIQGQ